MIVDGETVSITANPALNRERQVMILEQAGGRARAALTPMLAERLGVDRMQPVSAGELRQCLTDGGIILHDPDLVFYLPAALSPGPVAGPVPLARQLSEADRDAFDTFRANASAQDLEDASVELDHWAVFGSFDGGRLVSVASAYPWDNVPIADLGVLTLPGSRGQGRARAVVEEIGRFAREQGYEPQYRCQLENKPSIALATATGFALFGTWEVFASGAPGGADDRVVEA